MRLRTRSSASATTMAARRKASAAAATAAYERHGRQRSLSQSPTPRRRAQQQKPNEHSGRSPSEEGADSGSTLGDDTPSVTSGRSQSPDQDTEPQLMFTHRSKHLKVRKRPNSRMHRLFPELVDEVVLDDFSCALQKDILVHGRLYVSERHFCFYANIFGWITKLVIDCRDVQHLRKEKTALIIPNAIKLETNLKAFTFASFLSRDTAYR